MDLGLNGRVALVAAASQGLGRAIALELAREGAALSIFSRNEAAIEAVAGEIRGLGSRALAQVADVRRPEDLQRVVESTVAALGGIDVLVTNAGGPPPGTFGQLDDGHWQQAFELTLMSVVRLVRGVLPSMRARGGGSIVVLTSSSVKQPIGNLLLSNVLRSGVAALVKSLADELAPEGIRVNNLVPGRIRTARIEQLDRDRAERLGVGLEDVTRQQLVAIPMGRYGEAEEFAAAAAFLASARASYITGATLVVDGGMIRSNV